jgi:RNA binding exosome subunit
MLWGEVNYGRIMRCKGISEAHLLSDVDGTGSFYVRFSKYASGEV